MNDISIGGKETEGNLGSETLSGGAPSSITQVHLDMPPVVPAVK